MRSRVTARPSGTEPKLKYYDQLYEPTGGDVGVVKGRLAQDALAVAEDVVMQSGNPLIDNPVWHSDWKQGIRRLVCFARTPGGALPWPARNGSSARRVDSER